MAPKLKIPVLPAFLGTMLCFTAMEASSAPAWIRPGEVWPDDRGRPIQAHGGGVMQLGDTFYWFGEDRSRQNDPDKRYVSCYASKDLAHWTFRNQVLKLDNILHLQRGWAVERPKVFYNAKTKRFVLYFHLDGAWPGEKPGYNVARVGVATSDTVDGHYTFLKSFRPLGHESRDIGQFIDDDGTAYLIFEDRPWGFRIVRLSDDYLTPEKQICLVSEHLEGGALVHYDGLYYFVGSELTGWNANPNKYATAKLLTGPWSEFKDIAPPATRTYGAQSTMLFKVTGARTTTVIFMADLWKPHALWDSRYLWMPLEIGGGQMRLPKPAPWTLDVKTGEAVIH
jgi:Glycosyl hydrolases family 43